MSSAYTSPSGLFLTHVSSRIFGPPATLSHDNSNQSPDTRAFTGSMAGVETELLEGALEAPILCGDLSGDLEPNARTYRYDEPCSARAHHSTANDTEDSGHAASMQPRSSPLLVLGENIILTIATLNHQSLPIPVTPSAASSLAFLSCCREFQRIEIPVRMIQPQNHTRDWTPRSTRFQIREARLAGDAIDNQQFHWVASHGTDASHLASLSLSLCRTLTDLSPLITHTALSQLVLTECHSVADLSPLQLLTSLEKLEIVSCFGLMDASPLVHCRSLIKLRLENNLHLQATSMLEACVAIQELVVINGTHVYKRKAAARAERPHDREVTTNEQFGLASMFAKSHK